MKKILAWILATMLLMAFLPAVFAEEETETFETEEQAEPRAPIQYDYDELTVAVTTPLTGNFFTNMWGNNSSDLDIRSLIHGYNLIEWNSEQGMFVIDESVVSGITAVREENEDLTFILALYDDLLYNDGTPITARDYAFTFLLSIAPEMKELGASVKTPVYIRGYQEYISGEAKSLAGLRVLNDHMLSITIDASYLPFFYELGLLDCVPYPVSVIAPGVRVADDGKGVYLANENQNETEVRFTADLLRQTILDETSGYLTHPSVTSGPYTLLTYENGTATLEANANYKGNSRGQKPMIPRITVVSLGEDEQVPALADGSITVLNKASGIQTISDALAVANEDPLLTSTNYLRSGLSFIGFNTDRQPLDELAVRQAIAYLADRQGMITEMVGPYGLQVDGYLGLGQWMYQVLNGTMEPLDEPEEGADAQTVREYEEAVEAWAQLNLEDIRVYDLNPETAAALLDEAGWNLNANGEAFDPANDTLRYKKTEDGLVPLKLTLAYAEGSAAGPALEGTLVQNLAAGGIELTVSKISTEELMNQYYRNSEVTYDMLFLATNFDVLYDPSGYFTETEEGTHVWKYFGFADEELWEMTVDLRRTEPGDLLSYCTKWLAFQEAFAEKLPALPIYSNVYVDFYPLVLHEYLISTSISWPQAITGAYLADYVEETADDLFEDGE